MHIGVFDSGLGGLTILDAIRERLPHYDYIYYGDTKNLPYGDKSETEIYELTKRAVTELFEQDSLLVIIACNTASAETLRRLQDTMLINVYKDRHVLGVIIPTIEMLLESGAERALLIGTRRTIESHKYDTELAKHPRSTCELTSVATPELVPLIESHNMNAAYQVLDRYLSPQAGKVDTFILGCTHYTTLKQHVRETYPGLRVISQDELIPDKLEQYLHAHPEIETALTRGKTCEHIITGAEPGCLNRASTS
jgi:glutamate racemase